MIQYWTSDSTLDNELLQLIKKREIDQKYLYMWEWANCYYNAYWRWKIEESKDSSESNNHNYTKLSYLEFLQENIFSKNKNKKWVLISLWCGNWYQEKNMLEILCKKWENIDYIWVDCSKSMLKMAQENLSEIKMKKKFVYSDFISQEFANEIELETAWYDYKIFAFLWCTFWNPNQTSITDSLYNMLWPNDFLLLDLASREASDSNMKLKLFERYSQFLEIKDFNNFRFTPLKRLWIDMNSWKMVLKTSSEESIWSYAFKFVFKFTVRTVIKYKKEKIHFLPWEEFKLLTIRNYDLDKVRKFFSDHDFYEVTLETAQANWWLSVTQFLFKRK